MAVAHGCGHWSRKTQPRQVPLVITSAVVLSCLLVLLLDWAFSQLYVRLPDIVPAQGDTAGVLDGVSLGGAFDAQELTPMHAEGAARHAGGSWHGGPIGGEEALGEHMQED